LTEYSSSAGKFKVQMPGDPRAQGNETSETATFSRPNGEYRASFMELSIADHESVEQVEKLLDQFRDGGLRGVDGKLTAEKKIKLADKHPGREVRADVVGERGKKGIMRARIYLVGKRLYSVMVVGTSEVADSAGATRFLDSFQLTQ
jgi:hypothetical protein